MEPTESAAPYSRLRRLAGAWRGSRRAPGTAERPRDEARVTGPTLPAGPYTAVDDRTAAQLSADHTSGLPGAEHERHLSWPALPAAVVAAAGFVLGAGFYRAFTGSHALFPSGAVGWSLAVLTGVIV